MDIATKPQTSCHIPNRVGMRFANNLKIRVMAGQSGASWVSGTDAFIGLSPNDKQILDEWLVVAKAGQIDRVIDFGDRRWNVAGLDVVLGVFEAGGLAASWLLVRYQSCWVLAQVGETLGVGDSVEGEVSDICDSLPEALALIRVAEMQ